jgi:hypothetical protein
MQVKGFSSVPPSLYQIFVYLQKKPSLSNERSFPLGLLLSIYLRFEYVQPKNAQN